MATTLTYLGTLVPNWRLKEPGQAVLYSTVLTLQYFTF